MKKLIYVTNSCIAAVLLVILIFGQTGCKKDSLSSSNAAPIIKTIRSYVASPGDSILTTVGTGQWVVISGKNLKGALKIYFDGVSADFNDALFSDTSAVVMIPEVIAFPLVPSDQLNTITYVTTRGQTVFSFPIIAPPPVIGSISNEYANEGDSVRIFGLNFFMIESLTYGGLPVTGYKNSTDGTSISLAVPAGITSSGGVVSVTTKSGKSTTVYRVHDYATGVLQNYDDVNNFSWGSGSSNSATDHPGNTGNYGVLHGTNLNAYNSSWWEDGRSINLNSLQLLPVANLNDTLANYAVKFEISVTKPWSSGSIYVDKDFSFGFIGLYAPWRSSTGASVPFTTKGWQTVTIPLSNFRSDNGTGTQVASIEALLGSNGSGGLNIFFMNDGPNDGVTFEGGFDNIRLVKIK